MEKIKKARSVLRRVFTNQYIALGKLLEAEHVDSQQVRSQYKVFEDGMVTLSRKDEEIFENLLEIDAAESELETHLNEVSQYKLKFETIKVRVSDLETVLVKVDNSNSREISHNVRKFKLPVIEFRKYGGDVREWIPFWSQFNKVHEDVNIPPEDKFLYLMQAMVPGSRANDIVSSYPPSAENYKLAIEALKNRFGREDILIEVYIRELLGLVLQNYKSNRLTIGKLYDKLESHMRSLETLGVTSGKCASILCPLIESCMPEDFLRAWQRNQACSEVTQAECRLSNLMTFMKLEVQNDERISLALSGFEVKSAHVKAHNKREPRDSVVEKPPYTALGLFTRQESKTTHFTCIFCDSNSHVSVDCYKARDMSIEEKMSILKDKKCCFVCLKPNHISKKCKSKPKCPVCDRKHVILLCPDLPRNVNLKSVSASDKPGPAQTEHVLASLSCDTGVLLPTLKVILRGEGHQRKVRAVVDTGSQRSYILKSTAEEMKYRPVDEEQVVHSLFGGQRSDHCVHTRYRIYLSNLDGQYMCNFEVLDQVNICDNLPCLNGETLEKLKGAGITLSDRSNSRHPGPIELLLGADVAGKLFTGNVKDLTTGLVAVHTRLGWTVLGKVSEKPVRTNSALMVISMLVNNVSIADMWKLDLIGITDPAEKRTKLELQAEAERHFLETVTTDGTGRYQVHLPWTDGHPALPNNLNLALRRLDNTVRKLKDDQCFDEYQQVFDEWLDEGVIERIPISDLEQGGHYLPHRHVLKENSTTRVRPVFDASAHEKHSPSLNDCLEKGPNLIEKIPTLLLNFRMKKLGVVADIKRAFLQISLNPSDRDFLRFLWRDKDGHLLIFRHKRVVFGVAPSPFLLGAVIRHHLLTALTRCEQGGSQYSLSTIQALLDGFYVDNLLSSVDDEIKLERLVNEATSLMCECKFDLRGWECSDPFCTPETKLTNVLGIIWDRKNESLSISPDNLSVCATKVTKRIILSFAHKVFDPIGFTCPATLFPKILLRTVWELKLGWDEEVHSQIQTKFLQWLEELHSILQIKIPRWLPGSSNVKKWSLHTFCDASETAYAAVVFLRVETDFGVKVQLIQAKARLAPTKRMTIPRLELLAATIGARIHHSVRESFPMDCESVFWSDSSTTLAWIRREDQWAPFVWNRTMEIRKLTKVEEWRFVPGNLNPADLPSRGCSGNKLLQSSWWEGPRWLRKSPEHWLLPLNLNYDEENISREKRKTVVSMTNNNCENLSPDWYFKYFSQFEKLVRMNAWMYRFIHNCRAFQSQHSARKQGHLSVDEIRQAEIRIWKLVQLECFSSVGDKCILALQPFEDLNGLLRLKTKVSNRPDSMDFRFPVLLPRNHPVVQRLIRHNHEKQCHVGVQGLLAILREKYWVMGGRKTIRSVVSKCIICRRQNSKRLDALAPPLPVDRVREAAAFEITGIDLAGPIYLKNDCKAWVCLFTCGVVRAVHLELVLSLTTDSFLQALRRFVARRGRPARIFSDNGRNFTGANNAFRKIDWNKVLEYCSVERIDWKFNPPTAAWWGGWWERIIGLTKQLLRKVLRRSSLTYPEMETVLCDCECVLNSRPLTYQLDSDGLQPTPITPAMFIQDIRQAGMPECDVIESTNLERRLKYRTKIKEDLRRRFRNEYLGQLVLRRKGKEFPTVKIGDVVLVENDSEKRLDWPMATVTDLLPDKEGTVRLVKLKTYSGELLRPIQRIYPLLEAESEGVTPLKELIQVKEKTPPVSKDDGANIAATRSGRTVVLPKRYLD